MKVVRLSVTLVALAFLTSLTAEAQLNREYEYFRNTPAPIVDFSTTSSSIDVPDNFTISTLSVMVDIDHAAAADLTISLTGPTGSYTLSTQNGLAGANYENTIFDSNPGTAIPGVAVNAGTNVTAYFRGVYMPESTLPTSGTPVGTWTLSVTDNLPGDNGSLVSWGLIFNRYDNYRDIRVGADLNYLGFTTLNSLGLVNDVTPLPPYTVQGYRPLNNTLMAEGLIQNSQTPGVMNLTVEHKYPSNSVALVGDADLGIPAEDAYRARVFFDLANEKGMHHGLIDLMMRGDLYMTRADNAISVPLDVTPGSLAYDNGMVQNTLFPWLNECDANVYWIYAPQTITSVDIWQGSTVELEPMPSMSNLTINVWDVATNSIVATSGPVMFPPQGDKWVSYPFSPPVALPAGQYRVGYCLSALDSYSFGPGIGMDQTGSPFEPLGTLSKYYGFDLQDWSYDGGMTWNEDWFRTFNTKMIRPNFVQLSDVGVRAIYPNNGFSGLDVDVEFAAYAHYSYLPNQITFGKVWVTNNATNAVVGYQEKRVFLNAAPFMDTQTFNFPALTSGNYTVKAVVERPDDENLINNEYARTINIPFAPMVVITEGPITNELQDKITTSYGQYGVNVVFTDRMLGNVDFPENGKVLWVGDLSKDVAQTAREYVRNGGSFSILPDLTINKNPMSEVFSQVANTREIDAMNSFFATPDISKIDIPANSSFIAQMTDPNYSAISLTKEINTDNRIAEFYTWVKNSTGEPAIMRDPRASVLYSSSKDVNIVAERVADLSVVNLLVKGSKPSDRVIADIVNPANFELTQNYPNPFNPTTNVAYNLPSDANVTIRVFDMLGRTVATLINGFQPSGSYITTWGATNNLGQTVSSGIYLYRMDATPVDGSASYSAAKKMVLTR
jgi:subtilisin-like proprotein convertase family protein